MKDKKYVKELKDGKKVYFGAKGYTVKPGTPAGDAYCARSAKIKDAGENSPNKLSRSIWGCSGDKSKKVSIDAVLKRLNAKRV